jgi:tRNA(Ile)-lysidine synthase
VNDLPEQLDQTIRERSLFRRGQKILVAVSGGVDSMVLLHALSALANRNQWRLSVAHLNHQLRGSSSDADERLVARVAKSLRFPIIAKRVDVKKLARTGKLSIEMAARKARHEFLAQTAARLKISHIVLAHHADDQVELFFLRLFRGAGSEGLAGMKWRGPSPANPKIQLVRPLLECSKESLREYAAANKIHFREDASNAWLDIQRNLIRRELIPLLKRKYQPALERTILRVMEILRAESELMTGIAEEWLGGGMGVSPVRMRTHGQDAQGTRGSFGKLPLAIQRRCIQAQLLRRGVPADFALVERLRTSPGRPFSIVPQVTVQCDAVGQLHFWETAAAKSKIDQVEVNLVRGTGGALFAGKQISWRVSRQRTFRRPTPQPCRESFDADKVGARIVLRHWRPGDRFQPIGMARAVKLQDLFTNQKIPRARRHDLVVATTAENEVFWVEGLRVAERFKLTPQTTRRMAWRWKPGKNAGVAGFCPSC